MKIIFPNKYVKTILLLVIIGLIIRSFVIVSHYIDNYLFSPDDTSSLDPYFYADNFIKFAYPEIKSLAIQFLTLVTAILIFSLTFSEKIVNYNQSKNPVRIVLIGGWTLLILAIISDGIGLAYNAIAYATALVDSYDSKINNSVSSEFYEPLYYSLKAILMGGAFFIAGLISIVAAGVVSLIHQTKVSS
jgi:hypothetical protein